MAKQNLNAVVNQFYKEANRTCNGSDRQLNYDLFVNILADAFGKIFDLKGYEEDPDEVLSLAICFTPEPSSDVVYNGNLLAGILLAYWTEAA